MTFDEYQEKSLKTNLYPKDDKNFSHPVTYSVLGLVGEAGEVADKLKKIYRESAGVIDDNQKDNIKKELGDVLWYLTQLSYDLGFSLNDVAQTNIDKLLARQEQGTIHGAGDNR
jgi:NTP pyrophosphatase (non-canonical NTP hydrolase)